MPLLVINITKVMRNASGLFSWLHLEHTLRDAVHNAHDLGLTKEMTILNKIVYRGQWMMGLSTNTFSMTAPSSAAHDECFCLGSSFPW